LSANVKTVLANDTVLVTTHAAKTSTSAEWLVVRFVQFDEAHCRTWRF